jgi:cell division protein FtsL
MTHAARSAFIQTQRLNDESQAYDVEWGRLLIERSNSSSLTRLENIASNQLNMQVPDVKRVVVLEEAD